MTKSTPTIERFGDTVVVVARNAEEAQQAATDVLGAACTVTAVERVRSGGVGGFFATELVRLTASSRRTPAPEPLFTGSDSEMEAVLASAEDLVASLNRRTSGFAERLLDGIAAVEPTPEPDRDHLDALAEFLHRSGTDVRSVISAPIEPAAAAPAAEVTVEPVAAPVSPRATQRTARHSSGWSVGALKAIGVPDAVVSVVAAASPVDETDWLVALMHALRPVCGDERPDSTVLVGPSCANLARQLRYMSVSVDELAEVGTSVAVPHVTARALAHESRPIHLVVGGAWQHLVTVPVSVVSAASEADLLDALRAAAAWDAQLGWMWNGDRYERIDPFTVAGRIRDLVAMAAPGTGDTEIPVR